MDIKFFLFFMKVRKLWKLPWYNNVWKITFRSVMNVKMNIIIVFSPIDELG